MNPSPLPRQVTHSATSAFYCLTGERPSKHENALAVDGVAVDAKQSCMISQHTPYAFELHPQSPASIRGQANQKVHNAAPHKGVCK